MALKMLIKVGKLGGKAYWKLWWVKSCYSIQYCPFVGLMSKLLSNKRHCKLGTAIGKMHNARNVQSPRTLCTSGNIRQPYNHLLFLLKWNSSLNLASPKNSPFPHLPPILSIMCKEYAYIYLFSARSHDPVPLCQPAIAARLTTNGP